MVTSPEDNTPGQLTLDGGLVPDRKAIDFTRARNSLSRALTPEYQGLHEKDYYDVTPAMAEAVEPDNMRAYLIGVPLPSARSGEHSTVVSYTADYGRREQTVTLTAQEAALLPRSIGALERNARIKTEAKVTTRITTDTDRGRMQRSQGHTHEARVPRVETYLESLRSQQALADAFIQASTGSKSGLSLMGGEARMRENLTYFRTFILGDLVRAYCSERNLTESQQAMVDKAIDVRIAFQGRDNITNFNGYARLAREHLGHRIEAASQRLDAMRQSIGRNLVSATTVK